VFFAVRKIGHLTPYGLPNSVVVRMHRSMVVRLFNALYGLTYSSLVVRPWTFVNS
jgi:hypothetical protein